MSDELPSAGSSTEEGVETPFEEIEKPEPPVRFEIVPDELYAIINLHEMRRGDELLSCWSFISEGLSKTGQKELAIFVTKRKDETVTDYPLDPLGFFLTVREFSMQGQFVLEGDITEFGESGFLDDRFRAMAYVKPLGISGVEDINALLSCVLLMEDELEVAQRFGLTRVVGILGYKLSHYPCPPWVDRDRESVIDEKMKSEMDESILSKIPQFRVPGLRVSLSGTQVGLRCAKGTEPLLRELMNQVPLEAPVVLQTNLDPHSNALLVWQQGDAAQQQQLGPAAITPPGSDGSKVSGASVLIFPEQNESAPQVLEDSFLFALKTEDWNKLRNGLLTGTDQSVSVGGGGKFVVEWYDVLGEKIESWTGEVPSLPKVDPEGSTGSVIDAKWLSSDEEIIRAANPALLCQFVEAVELTILGYFMDRTTPEDKELKVVCEISPEREISWTLSSSPEEDTLELKGIEIRLGDLPVPQISDNPISFELLFSLKGGTFAVPLP